MSVKLMIESVRDESPSHLGKYFEAAVSEKLSERLKSVKATVIAEIFGGKKKEEGDEEDDDDKKEVGDDEDKKKSGDDDKENED